MQVVNGGRDEGEELIVHAGLGELVGDGVQDHSLCDVAAAGPDHTRFGQKGLQMAYRLLEALNLGLYLG